MKTIINECDAGGAVNTSVSGGGNSVSAMAPENSTACVVQGIDFKKSKKPTSIAERIEARKARNAELAEAVEKQDVGSYLRKRDLGERITYSGSEEYEKLRKEWLSNKAKHDKTVENYNDGNPSRNPIGDLNMKNRYEDGQVDEFLAWYEDHEKGKNKLPPKTKTKKVTESTRLNENVEASDLFIFVPHGEVEHILEEDYQDVQGMVDDSDAWTLRADTIRELLEDYEDAVKADIYECPIDIAESEEPYFYIASSDLVKIEDTFCFFEGDF